MEIIATATAAKRSFHDQNGAPQYQLPGLPHSTSSEELPFAHDKMIHRQGADGQRFS